LDTITQTAEPGRFINLKASERIGYKVVTRGGNIFATSSFQIFLQMDEWTSDPNDYDIAAGIGGVYRTGFHCFATLKGARAWAIPDETILMVKMHRVVAIGKQRGKVIVARKIKLLKVVVEGTVMKRPSVTAVFAQNSC